MRTMPHFITSISLLIGLIISAAARSSRPFFGSRQPTIAFGYAIPDGGAAGKMVPPTSTYADDARVVEARRIGPALPTFPDTPTDLAHEISGSIAAMLKAGPSQRLRIDLQVDELSDLSDDWARAVGHCYLPFYEKILLTLRARGYNKVLAIFGHKQEAHFVEKRLKKAGALGKISIDYLSAREDTINVRYNELVLFFSPQTVAGDLSELSEFQRVTAVATLRGTPVIVLNPALTAFSHLPMGLDMVRPMILSDFAPCFQVSSHRYKYNPNLSYSIVRRGGVATTSYQPQQMGGMWEVFARDGRLPDSGWAYLETRDDEPFRLDVETKYFDSCFWIQKKTGPIPPQAVEGGGDMTCLPGRVGGGDGMSASRPPSSSSSSSSSQYPSEY